MSRKELTQFVNDEALVDLLYTSLEEAHPIDCECAWCNAEQGREQGDGSHGICGYHREEVYQAYKSSRVA
jgi:hypothetical protein